MDWEWGIGPARERGKPLRRDELREGRLVKNRVTGAINELADGFAGASGLTVTVISAGQRVEWLLDDCEYV